MSFTNEDLKKLKEEHQNHDYNVRVGCDICDLLCRLEAAEKVVEALMEHYCETDAKQVDGYYAAWRRSKGE